MKYYHGYSVVAATFICRFVGLGTFYSLGLFMSDIQATFDIGTGLTALFPSIVGGVSFFSVIFSGYAQDWLGSRNLPTQPTFALGAAFMGAGTIGASYADNFASFLLCGVLTGVSIGATCWASPGVCVLYFRKRRGLALAIALVGTGLGCFLYAIVTAKLLSKLDSWREVMRYMGVFSTLALIVASIPMRFPMESEVDSYENENSNEKDDIDETDDIDDDDDDPIKEEGSSGIDRRQALADMALQSSVSRRSLADIALQSSFSRRSLADMALMQRSFSRRNENTSSHQDVSLSLSVSESVRTRTYMCVFIWVLLSSFAYDTVFLFILVSAEEAGISIEGASLALALTGILLIVGNMVIGILSDKMGYIRTLQVTMFGCMAAVFAWPFCTSTWSLCIVTSAYSFFASAYPIKISIISEAYESTSSSSIMTLFSILEAGCSPGTLLGPVLAGAVTDKVGFQGAAFFLGGTYLLGNTALLFIPTPEKQQAALKLVMTNKAQQEFEECPDQRRRMSSKSKVSDIEDNEDDHKQTQS